jgi:lipid-A-disaccharide synthase-like uncharacterized protein
MNMDMVWTGIGFLGQFLFGCRFIVQWLRSEKAKQSVVPLSFWYLSLLGGAVLLAYAIYRRDPVFIFGQGLGLLIYFRNLQLIYKSRKQLAAP